MAWRRATLTGVRIAPDEAGWSCTVADIDPEQDSLLADRCGESVAQNRADTSATTLTTRKAMTSVTKPTTMATATATMTDMTMLMRMTTTVMTITARKNHLLRAQERKLRLRMCLAVGSDEHVFRGHKPQITQIRDSECVRDCLLCGTASGQPPVPIKACKATSHPVCPGLRVENLETIFDGNWKVLWALFHIVFIFLSVLQVASRTIHTRLGDNSAARMAAGICRHKDLSVSFLLPLPCWLSACRAKRYLRLWVKCVDSLGIGGSAVV